MHGGAASVREWRAAFAREAVPESVTAVVCPPFPFLHLLRDCKVALGGQDCSGFASAEGARTGEVSAAMLADAGCEFVLIGHSERRRFFGEDGGSCAAKIRAATGAGLRPILCVGETAAERERGETATVVRRQLGAALADGVPPGLVVGYEPVWAIGSGRVPGDAEIAAAHRTAGDFFSKKNESGDGAAGECGIIPVIYGGSVGAGNAARIFSVGEVRGALVGGASLRAPEFARICRAAEKKTETKKR